MHRISIIDISRRWLSWQSGNVVRLLILPFTNRPWRPLQSLSAPSMSSLLNSLQLPIEVWERVIDHLPNKSWAMYSSGHRDLRACCLTCRAWVTRCRVHLFRVVVLRTSTDFHGIRRFLNASPVLWDRVEMLIIRVSPQNDDVASQSWLPLVPIHLARIIRSLKWLNLDGVDLTAVHPRFYQTYSLFQSVEHLALENVKYSQYSQLSRFVSTTSAQKVYLWNFTYVDTSNSGIVSPAGRLFIQSPILSDVSVSLSWDTLGELIRSWRFQLASENGLHIKFYAHSWTVEDGFQDLHAEVLCHISDLFARYCSLPSRSPFTVSSSFTPHDGDTVTLKRGAYQSLASREFS